MKPTSRWHVASFRVGGLRRARAIRWYSSPVGWLACVGLMSSPLLAQAAGTYYVDNQSPSASDGNPGTESQPYRTISAAATARGGPGTTIVVKPGSYRENAILPASGVAGSPFILRAAGAGVVIDGADDYTSASGWVQSSGDVWLASSVGWNPRQVFADGARLAVSTAVPAALPSRSYRWISGEGLYVNAGGGNPGPHGALVGRRLHGFQMSGRAWIVLEGFTVTRADDHGIQLFDCASVTLSRNTVSLSARNGIKADSGSAHVLEANAIFDNGFHGIALASGATGCTLRDNESFRNADPTVRVSNGIYLFDAPGNTLVGNRLHDNQDSGLNIEAGSNNTLCRLNRSWNNGDHGYDHIYSSGTIHVCDVAYGNHDDGFSIEGGATGTQLHDCISVDNGLATGEFDLWVTPDSTPGFASDYNLFWNSTGQAPVSYISSYPTVAAYSAASGQDSHSIQADPEFRNAAGGDFHLEAGSPAIDSGDSGVPAWPSLDADGHGRVDEPSVPNTGTGPVAYADRGAFEFGSAPPANLVGNPSFEQNTAGWNSYSGATLVRAAGGYDGDYALQLTGTSTTAGFGLNDSPNWVAKTGAAGDTFQFAAWVRSERGRGTCRLHVREYQEATVLGSAYSAPVTLSPSWQRLSLDYGSQGSSSTLDFQVVDSPEVPGEIFQVDAISIRDLSGGSPTGGGGTQEERQGPLRATVSPAPGVSQSVLSFTITRPGPLQVTLFDVAGRQVRSLLNERYAPAGPYELPINGRSADGVLGAGVFFFRIRAAEGVASGRFVMVK